MLLNIVVNADAESERVTVTPRQLVQLVVNVHRHVKVAHAVSTVHQS